MLVAAPDGTIYVSQRTPGTLSMVKGTNGDGVADMQKVVAEKNNCTAFMLTTAKCMSQRSKKVFVADIKSDETNLESATILVTDLNGQNRRVYASGLRNTIGFGWHPVSGKMFGIEIFRFKGGFTARRFL